MTEPNQIPTIPGTTTMLLQIGIGWAVCTRTAVPIILARFPEHDSAYAWQQDHEQRSHLAA